MAFIDKTGLQHLWGHTVERLNEKADIKVVETLATRVPEVSAAHQQLVTGADGVARWEPRIDKPGDPHQYLTTDGDGKPHWEDKMAYEESAVVEIMPTTDVGTIWYSQKTVACPHNGAVKVGDTGYLYVDGTPYKYTAIEKVFGSGPPVVVQLDVEGQSNTGCLIGLTDDNKLLFYTCAYGSPMATHTVSMTHNSRTLKTFDPDLMGKNAGANKVLATDENGEAVWSDSLPSGSGGSGIIYVPNLAVASSAPKTCYTDKDGTSQMDAATGFEMLMNGAFLCLPNQEQGDEYYKPLHIRNSAAANIFVVKIYDTQYEIVEVMLMFA